MNKENLKELFLFVAEALTKKASAHNAGRALV